MVETVVKEGTRQNACYPALAASTVRRQHLAHKQQLRSFAFRHDGLPEPARAGHHDETKKRAGSEEREGVRTRGVLLPCLRSAKPPSCCFSARDRGCP